MCSIHVVSVSTDSFIDLKNVSVNSEPISIQSISEGSIIADYDGDYVVIPSAEEQTLPTKQRILKDDIIIEATPYAEVSNPSGGYTATIL
jgi:hypothetical protein